MWNMAKTSGKVYLIKAKGFNWYKIGKSRKTSKRLRWLYTNLPFEVELIHTIETDSIDTLERYFHKLFKAKRLQGEWFDLDEAEITQFKGHVAILQKRKSLAERQAALVELTQVKVTYKVTDERATKRVTART